MVLTKEELKNAHNNVMIVMENRIMSMVGCDRKTANLVANEVLSLDKDAEWLLNQEEKTPFSQKECDWRYRASCVADTNCADDCDMICPYVKKNKED